MLKFNNSFGSVTPKFIPTRAVTFGGEAVAVTNGRHRVLNPGQYASLEAFDGASITLSAGNRSFGSFVFQGGNITLDVDSSGGTARIDVQNEMRFGDRTMIGLSGNGFVDFYTKLRWPNKSRFRFYFLRIGHRSYDDAVKEAWRLLAGENLAFLRY